ncbi:oxamate carbamoyltransferase subunit AllH family protein [Brevibacterium renqingii]|uniref:oxamate carbamoyltransferase subunit AllH family protein n=1 Tax=Brevibacterium renqingii TaxID=2776916 RepID=UPI001ADFC480
MVLPATASLLPVPRIDAARVGGAEHSPIARDSAEARQAPVEVRHAPSEARLAPAEVVHVFAAGLYLAVGDSEGPRGPGRRLLPIMGPGALLLPFGLSVPQLDSTHLATLRAGTTARVVPAVSPMRLGSHPPIFEDHVPSPRWIGFPDFALHIVRTHRPLRVKTQLWKGLDPITLVALAGHLRPGLSDLGSRAGDLASALLDEDVADTEAGVRALIGAGPGSTPSGDDALSGIALALRSTGRNRPLDLLSRTLEPIDLAQATPALSAALIRAAVAGHCVPEVAAAVEAAHRLLTTPRREPPPRSAAFATPAAGFPAVLSPLDGIGHSSGHDLFTGFLAVLTALTCSRSTRPGVSRSLSPSRPPTAAMIRIRGGDGPRTPTRTPIQHSSKGTHPCHAH